MFERVIGLIGEEKFKEIQSKTILIVGLGGVGGYALESLVRSGFQNLILIDHDNVDITNLNRQIITTSKNIGKSKVSVAKERALLINPNCQVTIKDIFLDEANIDILNEYQIDYIVDACDTVKTKKLLIDYSIKNQIDLISSMGTANKLDPTKLMITDIRKTSYDPLAKILRKYVAEKKTNKKVMVVSSIEKPRDNKKLSTMTFVPATAGILCANYITKKVLED